MMRLGKSLFAICMIGSSLGLDLPIARADLSMNGWSLSTFATDKIGPDAGTTVPRSRSFNLPNPLTATDIAHDGVVSSMTDYNFDWDASGGSFNWNFSHEELGASYSPGAAKSSASVARSMSRAKAMSHAPAAGAPNGSRCS